VDYALRRWPVMAEISEAQLLYPQIKFVTLMDLAAHSFIHKCNDSVDVPCKDYSLLDKDSVLQACCMM
jgi:hypothetical protein